ncbi:MAG: TIGR04282 family arsenosugar biosynthesis glycosyltransferase, partial [Thermoleophilaceae bacterium]
MSAARSPAALVMAKSPAAGLAKTRLAPLLGAEGAALLQAELIGQALRWAEAVAPDAVFLSYTPEPIEPPGVPVTCSFPQRGADLGQRLDAAVRCVFERHDGPLLVVGTDTPTLTHSHAETALGRLDGGSDVCFGPALDGGYYLVGLARPCPECFALPGSCWGGPRVL